VTKAGHGAATLLVALFATAGAEARKAAPPPPLTHDQQMVVAAVVNDTFTRARRDVPTLTLCLDVQVMDPKDADGEGADEEAPTPPPKKRPGAHKHAAPIEPLPHVRGAPAELVELLTRPWRVVASALSCSTNPREPLTLSDGGKKTPTQLLTVHVAARAAGAVKIDWSGSHDRDTSGSRDCTASQAAAGWTVHCGGTWFQ
jgi:hypothetical protein